MNMGEAKAKRAVREAVVKGAQLDVGRVATAVRKLLSAISRARGEDCCAYAVFGAGLLRWKRRKLIARLTSRTIRSRI